MQFPELELCVLAGACVQLASVQVDCHREAIIAWDEQAWKSAWGTCQVTRFLYSLQGMKRLRLFSFLLSFCKMLFTCLFSNGSQPVA